MEILAFNGRCPLCGAVLEEVQEEEGRLKDYYRHPENNCYASKRIFWRDVWDAEKKGRHNKDVSWLDEKLMQQTRGEARFMGRDMIENRRRGVIGGIIGGLIGKKSNERPRGWDEHLRREREIRRGGAGGGGAIPPSGGGQPPQTPAGGGGKGQGGGEGRHRVLVYLVWDDNDRPLHINAIENIQLFELPPYRLSVYSTGPPENLDYEDLPLVFDNVEAGPKIIRFKFFGIDDAVAYRFNIKSGKKGKGGTAGQYVQKEIVRVKRKESSVMKDRFAEKRQRVIEEYRRKAAEIDARTDVGKEAKKELKRVMGKKLFEEKYTKEEREFLANEGKKKKEKYLEDQAAVEKGNKKAFEKKPYNWLFRGKLSASVGKGIGAAAIIGIGALVSAIFSSTWFMFAFISWGVMVLFPNPDSEEDFHIPDRWKKVLAHTGQRDFSAVTTSVMMLGMIGRNVNHPKVGWGVVRTVCKLGAIGFAIYGIFNSSSIPFKTIVMIIACFGSYYSLKISYKPNMPHHFLESVLRFGFLGCWMIPYIFLEYFQSSILALIALAFLAIPPIQEVEKASEAETSSMLDWTMRLAFFGIMVIVLIGSGVFGATVSVFGGNILTWGLTGALKDTFLYFWIISTIAGAFSSTVTRPFMGFVMLLAATVIYGIGPGQQEFGTALFGQWYPTIQNFVSSVGKPFGDLFGTLGSTFGSTWMLLTNPIGYAQQIQNGTYVKDPATGIAGAFGVELENIHATDIYNGQPYLLMMTLKNKGAYTARNVQVVVQPNSRYRTGVPAPLKDEPAAWGSFGVSAIVPGAGAAATAGTLIERFFYHRSLGGKSEAINMSLFGFNDVKDVKDVKDENGNYIQQCSSAAGASDEKTPAILKEIQACEYGVGVMQRLDVQQAAFSSAGINCSTIVDYSLMTKDRAKVLPFNVQVSYDYAIDSTMDIEFMSNSEWQRLAQLEQLVPRTKKTSQFQNAPVRLNIDTLEQPIREGTTFHIAFNLVSAQPSSAIGNVKTVVKYPEALDPGCKASCMAEGGSANPAKDGNQCVITKNGWTAGPYVMFCTFSGGYNGGKDTGGKNRGMAKPTESFTITANASYTFARYQSYDTRIQFGGEPCCNDDKNDGNGPFPCPLGISAQYCDKATKSCVAVGSATTPPSTATDTCTPNGATFKCEDVSQTGACPTGYVQRTQYSCPDGKVCCSVEEGGVVGDGESGGGGF